MNLRNIRRSSQRIKKATILIVVASALQFILCGVVSTAHAVGVHNSNITPASAYTEFAEMFPSVGYIFAQNNGVDVDFFSGVLIHPNFVLTAGHGILGNAGSTQYDAYDVGFGSSISNPIESNFADEVFVHPGFDGVEQGVDLGLFYFVDGFTSVTPAEIYDQAVQVGDVASIVGYGQTGTPATGAQTPDGVKRASQNIVEFTNSPDTGFFEYFFSEPNDPNFLALGGQGMPGDSGGGWFIQDGNDLLLAGITSGGSSAAQYGSLTSAYEVNLASAWINDTIASRTTVPEPSSMALLGLASLIGLGRRRRR